MRVPIRGLYGVPIRAPFRVPLSGYRGFCILGVSGFGVVGVLGLWVRAFGVYGFGVAEQVQGSELNLSAYIFRAHHNNEPIT